MLGLDGAYERTVDGENVVSRGISGQQVMRALKESLRGLRRRAQTDPPRIETTHQQQS